MAVLSSIFRILSNCFNPSDSKDAKSSTENDSTTIQEKDQPAKRSSTPPSADENPNNLPNNTVIITGHNSAGLAEVKSSKPGQWNWFSGRHVGFNVAYTTTGFPVNLNDDADLTSHEAAMSSGALGLVRPSGTVCRIVDFGPQGTPLPHRTQSLDYGIVLQGEVEMELDDGSVTLLKRGNVAVQRVAKHAWRNPRETQWTRMLFVLQDCEPVFVDGVRLKEDLGHQRENIPQSGNDEN